MEVISPPVRILGKKIEKAKGENENGQKEAPLGTRSFFFIISI